MITAVTHVTLFVADQDKALDFYTNKLGFKVHTDATFDGMRWLTICPKNQPNFEIALMDADVQEKGLIGKQGGNKPFLALSVDDCKKAYTELSAKGVTFLDTPKEEPWGIATMIKDIDGNMLYLVQAQ